jgi:hypothetical protein
MAKKKKRGPRGGVKHQPGRGHQHKSASLRNRRFQQKALRLRREEQEEIRKKWEVWDKLTDEQRELLPNLCPERPREFYDQ